LLWVRKRCCARVGARDGAPVAESVRAPLPGVSLGFGDDPAGDSRGGGCSCATGYRVDNDRGSAIAEDGMVIVAEGYVGRDHGNVGGAIGGDDERKIRDVAGGGCVMAVLGAAGIEVRASALEVRRIALRDLVNVDGVFARRKIFDVERDFDAFRRAGELRGSDVLAVGILEFHGYRFGSGAAVRFLGLGGRSQSE